MKIMIFDTETTSLEKKFCYNIGYIILDTETEEVLHKADYVVEQVWHNPMLFTTAYYSNKRNIYIERMRSRKTKMLKYGYICQQMIRDIKQYEVVGAYAYNSGFDEDTFNFNCDWFKCNNPFDNIPIYDIRGYVHQFLITDEYKQFCEENNLFTDSGNYSTTAETVYQFLIKDTNFTEEHTALADSCIETDILLVAIDNGAEYQTEYKTLKSIEREQTKVLTIKDREKNIVFSTECSGYKVYKTRDTIILK